MKKPHLHIAIPAIDELKYLPITLQDISKQNYNGAFTVYVCVNQPDEWWDDPEKVEVCYQNQKLIEFLNEFPDYQITILDYSSRGKGWKGKKHGVGWARKALFDHILQIADSDDVIICLDADTHIPKLYFYSLYERYTSTSVSVISNPYYHQLTEDDRANRAILRYELYMRSYAINMYLIESPFNFTAIGSAISMRVSALRKIGGITPMKSGEDFYLLQKFRKMGPVSNQNDMIVYPASRFSSRVYFGTGPAMIKGDRGDWNSYPIYHHSLFEEIGDCYKQVKTLYQNDISSPFIDFLKELYQEDDLWGPLRKNSKSLTQFTKAFHEKADGLRILQYLKATNQALNKDDWSSLNENYTHFFQAELPSFLKNKKSFDELSTAELDRLRDKFFEKESHFRFSENI